MRHFIVATGILVIAASSHAQSAASAADATTPPLTKSVVIEPNDSPLVRAAKRAVASRQHPSNRRVITITATSGRGRFAQGTGPTDGPRLAASSQAAPPAPLQPSYSEQAASKRAAETQQKLQQLEQEQQMVGAELDEPYGGDMEEDQVEQRLSEIAAERQQLQPPPPPPHE